MISGKKKVCICYPFLQIDNSILNTHRYKWPFVWIVSITATLDKQWSFFYIYTLINYLINLLMIKIVYIVIVVYSVNFIFNFITYYVLHMKR